MKPKNKNELIIGKRLVSVMEDINKAAACKDIDVLLTGETGTGRRSLATEIHERSRKKGELVKVDSYSSDPAAFYSCLEEAKDGTLLINMVEELHRNIQRPLLHFLDDKGYVNEDGETIPKDMRIIYVANSAFLDNVPTTKFNKDLYSTIIKDSYIIWILPLERCPSDVKELSTYFITKYMKKYNKNGISIDDSAMQRLKEYSWPGNVRQLESAIEGAIVLAENNSIIHPQLFDMHLNYRRPMKQVKI